jgi:hypothetical protein
MHEFVYFSMIPQYGAIDATGINVVCSGVRNQLNPSLLILAE